MLKQKESVACKRMISRVVALTLLLTSLLLSAAYGREVVVGVSQNAPKISAGPDGQPSGILGDLLVEIAREQQWQLKPVQCDWDYCLQLLQAGEIDLLPDVAYTEQRALQLDFHQTPALFSWSQLFTAPGVLLHSLDELEGKTVLVLQDSVQQQSYSLLVRCTNSSHSFSNFCCSCSLLSTSFSSQNGNPV